MRPKRLILTLLLFFCATSNAQPPLDWVQASTIGGGFQDYVEDVYVDALGNTFVCGTFRGSLTIGTDNLFATAAGQVFVAKFDATGAPQWAIQSNGNSQAFAKSIFVDDAGCAYVAGYHNHSVVSFAGLSLSSASGESFYLLKVNPNGLPLHLTGPTPLSTGKSQGWGVVSDGDFVYVTGSYQASLDLFGGGPTLPATAGMSDVFMARIDSTLSAWTYATTHGGTENDEACAITLNGANVVFAGNYGPATCTFVAPGPDYDLPAYTNKAMWLAYADAATGDITWATSAGSDVGPVNAYDVQLLGPGILVAGSMSDSCTFVDTPSPSGPFVYNDTLFSNGKLDAFVARYNLAGQIQAQWNEGGIGDDEAYGLAPDPSCSQLHVCGVFEDSVNFGGSTPLIADGKDLFVASFNNSGSMFWAFKELSTSDEFAASISSNAGRTSFGGQISGTSYFGTSPLTAIAHNGYNDHFVASFQCATPQPCGPIITNCLENDTVIADASCSFVLGDYTGSLVVTDGCSLGTGVTQSPPPLSILNAGTHEITLTATDGGGNQDICIFDLVVEADSGPVLVECGDSFTDQTTGGNGNSFNNFSCSSINTPGQEVIYQITVDNGNQLIQVKIDSAVDANDTYAYMYWLGPNCPNLGICEEVDSFEVNDDEFSNNSQFKVFNATGPGTYYLVIDCVTDSIQEYDIEFFCTSSGISFDESGCNVLDTDSDGIIAYVNASSVDLEMQPCESVNICHDIYIANPNDWEWVDSVQMALGDCYENINAATLTPNAPPNDNGFFDALGEWTAAYDAGSNYITWNFAHSTGNAWGDGNTGQYNCQLYNFCFDADITSTCATDEGLTIGITIGDDSGKNTGNPANIFDVGNSNDFTLQDDNPFFSYSTNIMCDGDPNVLPDSITTAGGSFTATAGIVFTDGSPSPTGEIDLGASSIGGTYTVTYTVGLCPFTHDFMLDILAQENPAFNYSAANYCQGDTDPVANITGTGGGTFTGPVEITFVDNMTGEIDLNMSTAGGPYWIVYTTPGPNCVNSDSVQVTIDPEDDPSFNYASIDHCNAEANVLPTSITTPGGMFSEFTTNLTIVAAGTGEVNIAGSTVGNYYVVYTTSGICPNTDSVQFNVLAEDDPNFDYPAIAYCQGDADPVGNIIGTGGGTFTGPGSVVFQDNMTGEIDLLGSTAGGPYTITYTTPGPDCPNSATFDITINPEDDSTFSYASSVICLADSNPVPTITGTPGGTFVADPGITFTDGSPSPTGTIDILASTVGGPYTVTYTTPGPDCPNSMDFVVSIFPEDDPTFSYPLTTYCSSDTDPIATITLPGGTFTGGVTYVDNMTGEIDLDGSTAGGPFDVIYTTAGPECPNSDTVQITIIQQDDPSFEYTDSLFCQADLIAAANILGTVGGTFSTLNTELILNTADGQLDLMASTTGGPYTVQYLTTGTCPDSSFVNVTIFEVPTADAGPDQSLFMNYETNLAAVSPNAGIGTWTILSGAGNIVDPSDSLSLINSLVNGTTVLQWTVTNGACPSASDDMEITIMDLFIPEALTPNNDNQNDLFVINGVDLLTNNLEIFNRWGQKVYEQANYQNDWGGLNMNGNELSPDTYFFILEVEDLKFKGFIVLER